MTIWLLTDLRYAPRFETFFMAFFVFRLRLTNDLGSRDLLGMVYC
eukprot:COSAG02_NODE_6610_length_3462_cov_2.030627_3_plen_45_part_00